jgi:TolA-binding protein
VKDFRFEGAGRFERQRLDDVNFTYTENYALYDDGFTLDQLSQAVNLLSQEVHVPVGSLKIYVYDGCLSVEVVRPLNQDEIERLFSETKYRVDATQKKIRDRQEKIKELNKDKKKREDSIAKEIEKLKEELDRVKEESDRIERRLKGDSP